VTIRVLFFAYLRERCGAERLLTLPEGASVGAALRLLREQYPVLADASLRVALNRVYVDNTDPLHENDELALIPPVSGGSQSAGTEQPTPCT
jgi:molybdopterin converting factor subunit 1